LLGYRSMRVDGPGFDVDDGVTLLTFERDDGAREELRAWAKGRVRMVLRSLPREALQGASTQVFIEGLADLYRASRGRHHPDAILRGFIDGLVESRSALDERRKTLGRRRVGEEFVRETFRRAEADMDHCRWQRVLQSVSR
jgi:hypothetical protein